MRGSYRSMRPRRTAIKTKPLAAEDNREPPEPEWCVVRFMLPPHDAL